jgi:uncharacterized repeat protein (TIGR02543 family)
MRSFLLALCVLTLLSCGSTEVKDPWSPPTVTVTFDSKRGTPAIPQTRAIAPGAEIGSIAKPADPTRTGYKFTGWSLDEIGKIIPDNYLVNDNLTLYAQWDITLGMFYFGLWTTKHADRIFGNWNKIQNYDSDLEPLELSWYNNDEPEVLEKQMEWMAEYGIDFISFCWYWRKNQGSINDEAVKAYLQASNRADIDYALLWCNHPFDTLPRDLDEWKIMVDYWINNHFNRPEYLYIDGKPVIFIVSPGGSGENLYGPISKDNPAGLREQAWKVYDVESDTGEAAGMLLEEARKIAREAGLEGVYFVLCASPVNSWAEFAENAGVDAITAYNYMYDDVDYVELTRRYNRQWDEALNNTDFTFFPPMISGWDDEPWEGSANPRKIRSTPAEFARHLREARTTILNNMEQTRGIGIFYAWNEYGEGGIIEPNNRDGYEYLKRIKDIFRTRLP